MNDIRIITEPSVYVVGKQTVGDDELNRFLADHGVTWESDSEIAGEVLTETAGRLCYFSFAKPRPGGNAAYLQHIKESMHGSVLEHAVWNFVITGVSRTLTHELVRHRAGMSYSQLSQRYVDESVAEYVEPDIIANDPELHAIWLESVKRSHAAYEKLAEKLNEKLTTIDYGRYLDNVLDGRSMEPMSFERWSLAHKATANSQDDRTTRRKTARQAARSVLPNATETKIFVTANARALRHFLEQRGSAFAEPEIRKLAGKFLDILQADAPNLFGDYFRRPLADGTCELTTAYKKV